jgi:type I restriction enzyme S subunit
MSRDWNWTTVDEIKAQTAHAISMGPFGSDIKTDNFVAHGIPVIRGVNLSKKRFNEEGFVFVSEEKANELKSANAYPGDIVFTHRGTLGQIGLIPSNSSYKRYVISQSQMKLTCDSTKADPLFIFYYFRSPVGQRELLKHTSTTGVPALSHPLTSLKSIRVPLPPIVQQRAIADVLDCLDARIELNDKINATLEALTQAIFKHWFIDFEFPNEHLEPYKSSAGKMKDSELGLIPEAWEAVRLADFISLDKGISYKGKFLSQQGNPMINLATISPDYGFIRTGLKYYTGEFRDKQKVRPGDVVIANTDITQRRDVLGSPAIVPDDLDSENILFTHHIFAVRNNSKIPNLFIYYLLKLKSYRDRVTGFATGTTVLALPPDTVLDFLFAKPDDETLKQFNVFASLVHNLFASNNAESRNLATTRDILLPKLMHLGVGVYYPTNSAGSTKHNTSETA